MSSDYWQARVAHLSEEALAEAYLGGTACILAGILIGTILLHSLVIAPWVGLALVPVVGLAGLSLWLRRLPLDSTQIWRVAMYGALGTGLVTVLIVLGHLTVRFLTVSPQLTAALVVGIAASTCGGTLVGITIESRRSTQQAALRSTVMQRVLRHNLRNDLTVVLSHIDTVKTSVGDPERQQLATAERKLNALVDLVDTIRQANISVEAVDTKPIDLATRIDDRVSHLRRTHPEITLRTDLPEEAWVYAEDQFGLVIDNIVESAIISNTDPPSLHIAVTREGQHVTLCVTDRGETIPEADFAALTAGSEDPLSHGRGVELWLASWLTERSNGTLDCTTNSLHRQITISLRRAPQQNQWPTPPARLS